MSSATTVLRGESVVFRRIDTENFVADAGFYPRCNRSHSSTFRRARLDSRGRPRVARDFLESGEVEVFKRGVLIGEISEPVAVLG